MNCKYYIDKLTEDVDSISNQRMYAKGVKGIVWEDKILDCYWVVNSSDNFKTHCAKKLYELIPEKINE